MKNNHCEMHLCSDEDGAIYTHYNEGRISVDLCKKGISLNFALSDFDCKKLAEMLNTCYNLATDHE